MVPAQYWVGTDSYLEHCWVLAGQLGNSIFDMPHDMACAGSWVLRNFKGKLPIAITHYPTIVAEFHLEGGVGAQHQPPRLQATVP